MTEKTIKRLTAYYTKAIRKGKAVKDMHDAIFATIYHGFSTDARPRHNLCPKHVGSWCFYQDAKARGLDPKKLKHKELLKTPLDYNLLAPKIRPLYRRLADPVILTRCLSHATQNANENLHGKIWRLLSKNQFHSARRVSFLATHAISEYNFGCAGNTDLKAALHITESQMSKCLGLQRMQKRIDLSLKRATARMEGRLAVRRAAQVRCEKDYGPGNCGSI